MKWFAILLILLGSATAQDLASERLWKGTNGKSFRGIFVRTLADGQKVEIASSSGKIFTVALENLSEPDRKLIAAGTGKPGKAGKNDKTVEFKPLPPLDRTFISKAPNQEVGLKWPNSVTQAIGGYLFWWDLSNLVAIPRRGDADKKCEWVIDKLKRRVSPRNASLASHEDLMEGLAYYFDEELKDTATYRFHLVVDPTPESIAEFTKEGDACFLQMFNDGWGIWFPVIDVQGNDVIRVAYEGKILALKWSKGEDEGRYLSTGGNSFSIPIAGSEPVNWNPYIDYVKKTKRKPADLRAPVLEIVNKNDVPSHWAGDELIFAIRPSDPMVVCRPFAFAKPGEAGPPPTESGFGPQKQEK